MPARSIDDDPYRDLPDPTKAASKKSAARTPDVGGDDVDDPYRSLPDPSALAAQGVRIAGINAAGGPILAPEEPSTAGDTWSRFGPHPVSRFVKSTWEPIAGTVSGTWHGLTQGPQSPEEADIVNRYGPIGLRLHRFVTGPMQAEYKKARELESHLNPNSPWYDPDRVLMYEHAAASGVPLIGPALMQAGERIGTQYQRGDIAGAAGTLAGNVALYEAPKLVGKGLRSKFVTETLPRGMVTRMIRPAASDLKFGKNPSAAILDEKITGNTLEAVGNKVSDRLAEVGKQLDAEAQKPVNASKVVDVSGSLKPIDDAMAESAKAGDKELFNGLLDIRDELSNNWRPFRNVKGELTLRKVGPRNMRMSPAEALQFKRMVGDRVRWSEEPVQGAVNKALAAVYGKVKDATNNAVPGLKELNERYSNLVGAAKSIQRRLPIDSRNAHWSLSDIALAGTGHIPLAIARHVARMPAIRSRAAAGLYAVPKAPKVPTAVTAPVTAAAQSSGQRLKELREEARRRQAAATY